MMSGQLTVIAVVTIAALFALPLYVACLPAGIITTLYYGHLSEHHNYPF
jgi:hypothetical protein